MNWWNVNKVLLASATTEFLFAHFIRFHFFNSCTIHFQDLYTMKREKYMSTELLSVSTQWLHGIWDCYILPSSCSITFRSLIRNRADYPVNNRQTFYLIINKNNNRRGISRRQRLIRRRRWRMRRRIIVEGEETEEDDE